MLAGFRRLNEDISVGSADGKVLYPCLDVDFSIEKVCEEFHASKVRIVGLNVEELRLYLALTEEELRAMELLPFCPQRRTSRGQAPTITRRERGQAINSLGTGS